MRPKSSKADQISTVTTEESRNADHAVQHMTQVLEEEIVLGVLHPRERLVEDELMARFSTKRHIVRQALADMEKQGLVQRKKNSGAQVRALSPREVVEIYALREILETSSVKLISLPVPPKRLAPLIAIQKLHTAAVRANDPRAVFRANLAFHAALHALSGNETLIEAIAEYARRTYPVRLSTLVAPEYLRRARQDHEDIIKALRVGDQERLVDLCASHLRPSRDTYLMNLQRLARPEEDAA
ncbi:MAG: GntR family transcriptional regulator [Burkholderia sp.]|jgi:DNA-binding GntR family transcriptional regulator|nr:GntR family transcriptional regulator [Burkholderia sp.]